MIKLICSALAILVISSAAHARCYAGRGQWEYGPCESVTFNVPVNANTYKLLKQNLEQGFTGKRCRTHPKTGDKYCCYYEDGKNTHCTYE